MTEDHIPGEWRPDPTGRHEYRFWSPTDGWTADVANAGVNGRDDRGRRIAVARQRLADKRTRLEARRDELRSDEAGEPTSLRSTWQALKAAEAQSFQSTTITDDGRIESKQGSGPIAGATASVGTRGDIERRITATRLVLTGPFALAFRKKKDHRELHLLIEGRGFAIIEPVPQRHEQKARRFAANVNATAKQAEAAAAAPAPTTAPSTLDNLEQLGRLHRDGVLTDDEFADQKRRIIESS